MGFRPSPWSVSALFLAAAGLLLVAASLPPAAGGRGPPLTLSDVRWVDYDSLAASLAGRLGVDAGGREGFYLVHLSGRTLRLTAGELGAAGLRAEGVAFAAYVPGRGWLTPPCRVYDEEVYVNGTVVSLLRGARLSPDTVVEVKLPTYRPVEPPGFEGFPEGLRGARSVVRVDVVHPEHGLVATVYAVLDPPLRLGYCMDTAGVSRLSGYTAHQQPYLAIVAFKSGRAQADEALLRDVKLLTVAAAFNPVKGVEVQLGPAPPAPDGGGGATYAVVYDVRGMHAGTALAGAATAAPGAPASLNVTLLDGEMYGGLKWARLAASVSLTSPSCQGDYVVVEAGGARLFKGWVEAGSVVTVTLDAGLSGSTEPYVVLSVETGSCEWRVNLIPVVVSYLLPRAYLEDYTTTERVDYEVHLLPEYSPLTLFLPSTDSSPSTFALAYPLPAPLTGGLTGEALEVNATATYTITGSMDPASFPVRVDYYVGGTLACSHEIPYEEAVSGSVVRSCSFILSAGRLASTLLDWPWGYVVVTAESSGPVGSRGIFVILQAEVSESGVKARMPTTYYTSGGEPVATSMIPSSSPLWLREVRYSEEARFYAIVIQRPTGQYRHLGIAELAVLFNLYRAVPTSCEGNWVEVASDWALIYSTTSLEGAYYVEWRGRLHAFETVDVDLRAVELNITYGPGMQLTDYSPRYLAEGPNPKDPIPDIPPVVAVAASLAHPRLSAVIAIYELMDWGYENFFMGESTLAQVITGPGLLSFRYQASGPVDLSAHPPAPHFYFNFIGGCGAYEMGWGVRALFEAEGLGSAVVEDYGVLERLVAPAPGGG